MVGVTVILTVPLTPSPAEEGVNTRLKIFPSRSSTVVYSPPSNDSKSGKSLTVNVNRHLMGEPDKEVTVTLYVPAAAALNLKHFTPPSVTCSTVADDELEEVTSAFWSAFAYSFTAPRKYTSPPIATVFLSPLPNLPVTGLPIWGTICVGSTPFTLNVIVFAVSEVLILSFHTPPFLSFIFKTLPLR